ncbi:redoxin domain-containing protein [Halosolutus amylolyticus]|uniref:Redoxin domain-containing protein n=1 Tax=Halosolutus amylolyticus TaxID=2932267 RepID=A0ABD5PR84_9EURY|nr:redoxin domain-containing protein [Halosolutus amylolyticus]
MLEPGESAPTFERPAAVDGEVRRATFDELVGDTAVVVVVFYPADFSPVCTDELCSLRDFDLFGLQPDVSIVGVSTDSAYSHRAFAERNDLDFPLVSDGDGSIADAYGVLEDEALDGHRTVASRSVFVLDADRTVRYAWAADERGELPDLEAVRSAIESASDDETAVERYRVAHRWYHEGLEAYTQGHTAFVEADWLSAAASFEQAVDPLTEAIEAFDAARRYATDERVREAATTANEQATDRRNAAKWYAEAARRYGKGDVETGDDYRADADRPHAAVDRRDEPAHPDALVDLLAE